MDYFYRFPHRRPSLSFLFLVIFLYLHPNLFGLLAFPPWYPCRSCANNAPPPYTPPSYPPTWPHVPPIHLPLPPHPSTTPASGPLGLSSQLSRCFSRGLATIWTTHLRLVYYISHFLPHLLLWIPPNLCWGCFTVSSSSSCLPLSLLFLP